jgi:hypothetical protein
MKFQYPLIGGLLLGAFLWGCIPAARQADPIYKEEVSAGLEEIYLTRTTRMQYQAGATPACSAAPFASVSEQHYDTWSLGLRGSDGRVVNTHEQRAGQFMACFAAISPNGTFAMYSQGTMRSLTYGSIGECRFMQSKPPAPKLIVLNCSGDLSGLPKGYVGGYLTASSLAPTGGKDAVHVRGYLSTSVITMRLWRTRASRTELRQSTP